MRMSTSQYNRTIRPIYASMREKKPLIAAKMIQTPKSEMVAEHKHLLKVLKTRKGIKAEANKQSKELRQYEEK